MRRPARPAVESAGAAGLEARRDRALIEFSGRALGSRLRLTVRGADQRCAGVAWQAVIDEFAAVDAALSRFRDDSELTALNRAASGDRVAVSRRLRILLALMDRAHRTTDGRFDPRVLVDLERIGERGAPLDRPDGWPDPRRVPWPMRSRVASVFRDRSAALDTPVDSGGAGKGLALRWAAERAARALPAGAGFLLDAGGDVVAAGTPPRDGWRIGIEDPGARTAPRTSSAPPIAVLRLEVGSVATSSTRVRQWRGPTGDRVHHLIDPTTGEPGGDGLVAVTVTGTDPAWAEVRSKSLFLAGSTRIAELARSEGLAAWWVDDHGTLSMTPGARQCSIWVDESSRTGFAPAD